MVHYPIIPYCDKISDEKIAKSCVVLDRMPCHFVLKQHPACPILVYNSRPYSVAVFVIFER